MSDLEEGEIDIPNLKESVGSESTPHSQSCSSKLTASNHRVEPPSSKHDRYKPSNNNNNNHPRHSTQSRSSKSHESKNDSYRRGSGQRDSDHFHSQRRSSYDRRDKKGLDEFRKDDERKKEGDRRREAERKRVEAEKRLQSEKKKIEMKKKLEEEKKKVEAEEKRIEEKRREKEERQKREAEERRKQEELRKQEEVRKEEERKKEEERLRREEEERRIQEEKEEKTLVTAEEVQSLLIKNGTYDMLRKSIFNQFEEQGGFEKIRLKVQDFIADHWDLDKGDKDEAKKKFLATPNGKREWSELLDSISDPKLCLKKTSQTVHNTLETQIEGAIQKLNSNPETLKQDVIPQKKSVKFGAQLEVNIKKVKLENQ